MKYIIDFFRNYNRTIQEVNRGLISVFDVIGPNMVGPSQFPHSRSRIYRASGKTDIRGTNSERKVYFVRFLCENLPGTWDR